MANKVSFSPQFFSVKTDGGKEYVWNLREQMGSSDRHGGDWLRQIRVEIQEKLAFLGITTNVTSRSRKNLVLNGA